MTIRIESGAGSELVAPNEVRVEFVDSPTSTMVVPHLKPELLVSTVADGAPWNVGRAGMRYRDLIPSRLGGRYIASHIEVCDGGPVPDLVHHHGIRFQLIFCHRGWVDVVYEDQGEPFRIEAGDCVLQPPHIRHRVLASSAGAQVVEIGCPAEHETFFDYDTLLPTATIDTERDFGGQRFVRHHAREAPWAPSEHAGISAQTTAISTATDGLANVRVLKGDGADSIEFAARDHEFWFAFVLDGSATFSAADLGPESTSLTTGDCVVVPAGTPWSLGEISGDLTVLEVTVEPDSPPS